jgi:2-methylcitrate dehydratase PrpD
MESSRLKVIMKDGREFVRYTEIAKGDPRNPISGKELLDKFWMNIDFSQTITRTNARKFVKMVEDLENLDSVKDLVDLIIA